MSRKSELFLFSFCLYRGVALIDINLNDTEINQCDLDEDEESVDIFLNVFRGTHTCHPDTKVNWNRTLILYFVHLSTNYLNA